MSRMLSSDTQPRCRCTIFMRADADSFLGRIVRHLRLDLLPFFGRQHRSRSLIGPRPRAQNPRTQDGQQVGNHPARDSSGTICMCANDGVRMRVR